MRNGAHLGTVDITLTGVFCAVFAVLNLILGPLSFQLLQLPILHDFAVFFPLLLVTWATSHFGTSSLVGIIGSVITVALGGPPLTICFAASAIIFDLLMLANRHRIQISRYSMMIAAVTTIISAYIAGVLIGILFSPGQTVEWTFAFWGIWHLIGGIMAVAIALPIIAALEKAQISKSKASANSFLNSR